MLTEATRQRVLVEWNDTRTDYPRHKLIHQLFEEQTAVSPDSVALRFGNETLTYRDLNNRANRLARHLRTLGVGGGSLVGLCMDRSVELVVSLLGILKAGAAYLPLDSDYPEDRLSFMLRDADAQITLADRRTLAKLTAISGHCRIVCADECPSEGLGSENLPADTTPEGPAYVMYTSGSTGQPKGVVVNHRAVVRLVRVTNYCDFGPSQVFLQLAPISFDASTFEVWGPLLNGAQLAVMQPGTVSLPDLGRAIRFYGVTTLWLTAGLFHLMVEQHPQDLEPLRQLVAGGDCLYSKDVRLALQAMPNGCVINGYGPTEGTTFSCCHRMSPANPPGDTVPIGRPIANTSVYVLDSDREPVGIGEIGELFIGGDGLASCYLNDPDLTSQKFVTNPFCKEHYTRLYRTGDLVHFREDGLLEFRGRRDNQVKIAGHRIEPGEIEVALSHHPAVRQSVVVTRTDGGYDKRLVAYVVATTTHESLAEELRAFLAISLPSYMVPARILLQETLPLSLNGKIDRDALPALQPVRSGLDSSASASSAGLEGLISQVWKRILNMESLGHNDNFFDLGGDSLKLIEAHAEIQKLVGREVSINDLFEYTTIQSLARYLGQAGTPEPAFASADERAARQREVIARQRQMRACNR